MLEDNLILKMLGNPVKTEGQEWIYQCPICKDRSKDNLKYNSGKKMLWCFASAGEHSRTILKEWAKQGYFKKANELSVNTQKSVAKRPAPEKIREWVKYQQECNSYLLNNAGLLAIARSSRGITKDTILACGVGYDRSKNKWVFPIYSLENKGELTGFEFRSDRNLQKAGLHRTKRDDGTHICLAQVNQFTEMTETLVIIEGFIDGYTLWQYFNELNVVNLFHIITPSNGIQGILGLLNEVDFGQYKSVWAYLDSDEPDAEDRRLGIEVMQQVQAIYPFINIKTMDCGCKDFNQHYLNCL